MKTDYRNTSNTNSSRPIISKGVQRNILKTGLVILSLWAAGYGIKSVSNKLSTPAAVETAKKTDGGNQTTTTQTKPQDDGSVGGELGKKPTADTVPSQVPPTTTTTQPPTPAPKTEHAKETNQEKKQFNPMTRQYETVPNN